MPRFDTNSVQTDIYSSCFAWWLDFRQHLHVIRYISRKSSGLVVETFLLAKCSRSSHHGYGHPRWCSRSVRGWFFINYAHNHQCSESTDRSKRSNVIFGSMITWASNDVITHHYFSTNGRLVCVHYHAITKPSGFGPPAPRMEPIAASLPCWKQFLKL